MDTDALREGGNSSRVSVPQRYGPVIAEFACAADARLFAGIKREAGDEVTITPAINAAYLFAVRALVKP